MNSAVTPPYVSVIEILHQLWLEKMPLKLGKLPQKQLCSKNEHFSRLIYPLENSFTLVNVLFPLFSKCLIDFTIAICKKVKPEPLKEEHQKFFSIQGSFLAFLNPWKEKWLPKQNWPMHLDREHDVLPLLQFCLWLKFGCCSERSKR